MFALSRRRRRLSDSGPEEKSRNPNPASTFVVVPVVQFPNACPTRLAVYGRSAEYCMGTDTHSGNLATAMLAIVKSCAAKVEKQASSERDLIETQLCLCSLYGGPCCVPDRSHGEVYSCEIKEWVRVNDEGLVRPAPSAPFKRQVSIDKETGNAVGDALSAANRWEVVQKGSQENAFVTLGSVGSRLLYEIAVYEFKIGREKPLIIAVRSHRGLFSAFSGICQ